MVQSMTGLGIGEAQAGDWTLHVELRSVNNRFLEASCRLPSSLSAFEQTLRERLRRELERGKIYAQVTLQTQQDNVLSMDVNDHAVLEIKSLLDRVVAVSGIEDTVTLEHMLKFSEIFDTSDVEKTDPVLAEAFEQALTLALEDMKRMRIKEGQALAEDMVQRIAILEKDRQSIESLSETNVSSTHEKFKERISQLMDNVPVDMDRLHTELALMADKMDVTEECVRLASHHKMFVETLSSGGGVGKKLNFLLQEMNREVNTISSKASYIEIQHTAVSMKNEIEKIREQVQNLV